MGGFGIDWYINYPCYRPLPSCGRHVENNSPPSGCASFQNFYDVTRTDILDERLRCSRSSLSSAEVQAFVISIRCAKCTAGAKSNGSIRRRTSARCMSISRTALSFSRTSIDFSALAKFDSLKLTETHG